MRANSWLSLPLLPPSRDSVSFGRGFNFPLGSKSRKNIRKYVYLKAGTGKAWTEQGIAVALPSMDLTPETNAILSLGFGPKFPLGSGQAMRWACRIYFLHD